MGHVTITTPLSEMVVIHGLGLATIKLHANFEVSTFTHYENMKGNKKCTNWGGFGAVRGHPRSLAT